MPKPFGTLCCGRSAGRPSARSHALASSAWRWRCALRPLCPPPAPCARRPRVLLPTRGLTMLGKADRQACPHTPTAHGARSMHTKHGGTCAACLAFSPFAPHPARPPSQDVSLTIAPPSPFKGGSAATPADFGRSYSGGRTGPLGQGWGGGGGGPSAAGVDHPLAAAAAAPASPWMDRRVMVGAGRGAGRGTVCMWGVSVCEPLAASSAVCVSMLGVHKPGTHTLGLRTWPTPAGCAGACSHHLHACTHAHPQKNGWAHHTCVRACGGCDPNPVLLTARPPHPTGATQGGIPKAEGACRVGTTDRTTRGQHYIHTCDLMQTPFFHCIGNRM